MLVQPSSSGKEDGGFHDTSFHNIMKCAVDIRKVVRECRVVTWHKLFAMYCGAHDEGIDRVSAIHDEIHGGCSTTVKVLGMDWRIHLVFPQHAHRFPWAKLSPARLLFSLCMQTLTLRCVPFFLYHRVQKKSFFAKISLSNNNDSFRIIKHSTKTTNNQQKPNNQKKQTKPNQTTTFKTNSNSSSKQQTANNIQQACTQEQTCLRGSYT